MDSTGAAERMGRRGKGRHAHARRGRAEGRAELAGATVLLTAVAMLVVPSAEAIQPHDDHAFEFGLVSPPGPQGSAGNTGAPGPQGVAGATGADGPQGDVGSQGSTEAKAAYAAAIAIDPTLGKYPLPAKK
jgi:hypothetical protein